jgi:hypothetical protein
MNAAAPFPFKPLKLALMVAWNLELAVPLPPERSSFITFLVLSAQAHHSHAHACLLSV